LFAYHPGRSGDHNKAIRCIEHLEGDGWQAAAGAERDAPTFLFAKCKVRYGGGRPTQRSR